ncbi:hypothetical protein, partial [Fulvivirga aurantia]|uniref:hypothetical protein n=1 Tax=Fulvivirga aurantia TaxID=2529383 RepID=UPI00162AA6ED
GLFVGFVLGVLPWQLRSFSMGGSNQFNVMFRKNYYRPESGTVDFSDMVDRVVANVDRIFSIEIPNILVPILELDGESSSALLCWLLGIIAIATIIYGGIKSRAVGIIAGSYLLFTILILLVWPDYFASYRYLVPVLPMLVLLFFYGIHAFIQGVLQKQLTIRDAKPYYLLLFVFLLFPSLKNLNATAKQNYPIHWAEFFSMARWSKNNVAKGSVICSRKPNLFYLYSGHESVNYRYSEDPDHLLEGLDGHGVDYVVYDQLGFSTTPRCLGKAIKTYPQRFDMVQYVGPEQRRTYFFSYK